MVYGAHHVVPVVRAMRETYGYVVHGEPWLTVADLLDPLDESPPVPDPAPTIARARAAVRAKTTAHAETAAQAAATVQAETTVQTEATDQAKATVQVKIARAPATRGARHGRPEDAEVARQRAAVARLRELAAARPVAHLARLSWALQDLSDALARHGLTAEALAAADDAADAAEELRDRTGAGPDDLAAWAAHTLGRRLREAGRGEDATALFAEAAALVREAFPHDPRRRAELAGMAVDHATQLLRLGRAGEAEAVARDVLACLDAAGGAEPGGYAIQRALAQRLLAAPTDG